MMKSIFFISIFLFAGFRSDAQHLYIPPQEVDSNEYRHYVGLLQTSYYSDSIKPNCTDKNNKWVAYYQLNAIPDTVFKYMWESIYCDPVYECYSMVTVGKEAWTKRNKKLEPRREFLVNRFCDSLFRTFDSTLIRTLDTMDRLDQKYRKSVDDAPWITGNEKKWAEQYIIDSINQKKLTKIIGKKGYPGKNIVGHELQDVAFLVIQHAGLSYQEKYLSQVIAAAQDNQMNKSNLPMMIDRINMRKGIPQIYGTQSVWNEKRKVMELYKVRSLKDVDKLRAEYDLGKLSDYLKREHIELPYR